jgi:hypothetical protein
MDRALLSPEPLAASVRARLAGEVLVTYVRVRWMLRRRDIVAVLERLRTPAVAAALEEREARRVGRRVGRVVERTLGPLPSDSRCLMRSLVVLGMLARRGVRCELLIGTARSPGFAAHAWLEHAGKPILPPHGYQPLTAL